MAKKKKSKKGSNGQQNARQPAKPQTEDAVSGPIESGDTVQRDEAGDSALSGEIETPIADNIEQEEEEEGTELKPSDSKIISEMSEATSGLLQVPSSGAMLNADSDVTDNEESVGELDEKRAGDDDDGDDNDNGEEEENKEAGTSQDREGTTDVAIEVTNEDEDNSDSRQDNEPTGNKDEEEEQQPHSFPVEKELTPQIKLMEDSAVNSPAVEELEPPMETQIASQKEPERGPTKLITSSEGPYSISQLKLQVPPSLGVPTAISHFNNNIYVGTSLGIILHYTTVPDDPSDYILISQVPFHSTRQQPIKELVPLPTLQILLVLSGSLLQCFAMPSPTPLSIGRIKDVHSIELDLDGKAKCDENGVHIVIMTKTQLRVVNVTKQALRLVKDVKKSFKTGKRRGNRMIVASQQYEFLDLNNERQTPLFPVNTSGENNHLKPFVQGVGDDEFLLACGTGPDEPSMGLVVNTKGDVSRGTIPMMTYPDNILVDDSLVFGLFEGNEVRSYSLDDQREVQSWKFSNKVEISKISPIQVEMSELSMLIRLVDLSGGSDTERDEQELRFAQTVAKVPSSLVCYCEDFIQLFVPQSRLQKLEHVRDIKYLEKELSSSRPDSELTVIEVEFLNLQLSILRLLTHQYDAALEAWTNGTLDPRILIYAFNYEIKGAVYIFSGLMPLFRQLKTIIKETAFTNFFELFLDRWLIKSSIEDEDICASLELTAINFHMNDHVKFMKLLNTIKHIDIEPILKSERKFIALADFYSSKDPLKALKIHKQLVDGEISDNGFDKNESLHAICEIAKNCEDDIERREIGMWLLKHDAKLGISFMNSSKISLHSLNPMNGSSRTEEVKQVLDSIDDVGLTYEYLGQVFVSLGTQKMKLALKKGMYKSLLKKLDTVEKTLEKNVGEVD